MKILSSHQSCCSKHFLSSLIHKRRLSLNYDFNFDLVFAQSYSTALASEEYNAQILWATFMVIFSSAPGHCDMSKFLFLCSTQEKKIIFFLPELHKGE